MRRLTKARPGNTMNAPTYQHLSPESRGCVAIGLGIWAILEARHQPCAYNLATSTQGTRMKLRISIALCTYNGAAHLEAQLHSLLTQRRLPDEIVIHDDGSTDQTWEIISQFAQRYPEMIRIHRHSTNQGFARNFVGCVQATTGDLIFPCDQDDIWKSDKLHAFELVFLSAPEVGQVFCDADLMDAHGKDLGATWWQAQGFDRKAQNTLESDQGGELMIKNPAWMAAGATMGFRACFKPVIFPIEPGWTHDAWIATRIAVCSQTRLIHDRLNRYRQHAQQVFGVAMTSSKKWQLAFGRGREAHHFIETGKRYEALKRRLQVPSDFPARHDALVSVDRKLTHWSNRARMRSSGRLGRLPLIAVELASGRYFQASQGLKSLVMDLLI
jgi:glycosyltransferase involved in cell wall biosynthesis